jgi:hypothetical protein
MPQHRAMRMSRKDRIGLIGMVAIVLFVAAAAGYFGFAHDKVVDDETLCAQDVEGRANRVIIVDKTDPLPPLALSNLKQTIQEQRDLLAVQDHLWIFAMSSDGIDISEPLFSRCRPSTRKDVRSFDSDPERVEKRYEESFKKPLNEALQVLLKPTTAGASPIIETLGRASVSPALASPGKRHIVFVTDLLQYSLMFSTYSPGWAHRPKPQDLADQMQLDFGKVFDSVDLTILVIDRHVPNAPHQNELREYWRTVLKMLGVTTLTVRNL